MTELINSRLISLDADLGTESPNVIQSLADLVGAAGRASDTTALTADAQARERKAPTGLPNGIAIPHCRTTGVTEPTLAFARLSNKVDFGAPDGPADIVFLIAAPDGAGQEHLKLLSSLARSLVKSEFTSALRRAETAEEIVALVTEAVTPAPPAPAPATTSNEPAATTQQQPETSSSQGAAEARRIVAVTACPTGIAHTYMAADALTAAAKNEGIEFAVETQGSAGATPLSSETIRQADAVIFATDVGVKDQARFAGKPVITSGVKRAINEPAVMLREAVAAAADPNARRVGGTEAAATTSGSEENPSFGLKLRQWLMTGVSYMIPFTAAGGLLIALGFLFAGYDVAGVGQNIALENSFTNLPAAGEYALFNSATLTYLGALLFALGAWAFSFLVPALAGYIAYAIADRPGIAPGFVMGLLANEIGAGFLGGIVGGLLAGAVAKSIASFSAPRWLAGLMPVVVIPLFATLVSGLIMLLVIGRPIASLSDGLTNWLNGLSGGSALLLGALLGAMMAFDLGGPVNKVAYLFATTGLAAGGALEAGSAETQIMAAVMIGGMVPPLAIALSALIRPRLYTNDERENSKSLWLLGAAFISEGAIPYAAADPLRVLPSVIAGSAVAGAVSMTAEVASRAPHGGVFVFFAIDNVVWFFLALAIGTVVGALCLVALKELTRSTPVTEPAVNQTSVVSA